LADKYVEGQHNAALPLQCGHANMSDDANARLTARGIRTLWDSQFL
jgi:hypothetical protein